MGKKKKKVYKVWCYYCEREFDDEKILIQHQKAKHFKCHVCHKKLSTAGGMQIHVLQVHKESITKVPNAKPDRESIDIEIFGMDGIPPEILAAHDGEDGYDEDEHPSKMSRLDFPPYGALGGGSNAFGMAPQPLYAMPPAYAQRPAILPTPSQQGWYSMQTPGPPAMPPRPPQPPQPLFPIQNVPQPPSQPLFPIRSTMPPSSMPQPLFPVNGSATGSPNLSVSMPLASTTSLTGSPAPPGSIAGQSAALYTGGMSSSYVSGGLFAGQPTIYTTDGIPPAIANKPQGPPVVNEVYLLWDDEAMSMEERRLSLPQYQVVDETLQMDSVDAAIDKRIQESRLAGRMSFKV